ncbi:hypothetical protein HBB16_19265 [Pseudonocardia sp. MCCB 268]|nr:hypothetical protein [Pseudonocardia cytotoxica]
MYAAERQCGCSTGFRDRGRADVAAVAEELDVTPRPSGGPGRARTPGLSAGSTAAILPDLLNFEPGVGQRDTQRPRGEGADRQGRARRAGQRRHGPDRDAGNSPPCPVAAHVPAGAGLHRRHQLRCRSRRRWPASECVCAPARRAVRGTTLATVDDWAVSLLAGSSPSTSPPRHERLLVARGSPP